ncbi:hypothetical protein HOD29_02570 [archaeon]|jgi:hypothetical protein|nr:hypothetical protein [archaeon]
MENVLVAIIGKKDRIFHKRIRQIVAIETFILAWVFFIFFTKATFLLVALVLLLAPIILTTASWSAYRLYTDKRKLLTFKSALACLIAYISVLIPVYFILV